MNSIIKKLFLLFIIIAILCSIPVNSYAKGKVETITLDKTMQYTFDWANDDFQHWYKFVPNVTGTYTAKVFTNDERIRDDSGAISIAILNSSEETIVEGLWSDLSLKAIAKAKLKKDNTYYIYIEYWQQQQIPMSTNITLSSLNLLTPKISKLTPKKKQLLAFWKTVKNVEGYEIQYSIKKNMKKSKKKTIKGTNKKRLSIKQLKSNKTYYVRIRAYKKYNGKVYYSKWSAKKKVKVK